MVNIKSVVLWDVTCSLVDRYRFLYFEDGKVETAGSFETLLPVYTASHTTRQS